MERELVLALVGIGFAILALGCLAIYQQLRKENQDEEKLAAFREAQETVKDAEAGSTPFFIARYRGSQARFFRIYADGGALLFLNNGPFLIGIDPDTPRGTDQRHWVMQAFKLLIGGLAATVFASVAVFAVVGRGMRNNPDAAATTIWGIVGIIVALAAGFVIAVPLVIKKILRRAEELDAMPLSRLREQAEMEKWSFRATAENLSDVQFRPCDPGIKTKSARPVEAVIKFRHQPTGKWEIETMTTKDTREALAALRSLLGPDAVTVDPQLELRLSW